jgi:hypothetical protein
MAKPNPNGSNQYLLDPRQKLCWESYTNPKSETFGNAYKSALKAGYEESTALQITTEKWFTEKVRRMNLLGKAEKVLDETLEYDVMNGGDKIDSSIARVKVDAAKHVTQLRGKEEGYESQPILVIPQELITKNESPSSTKPDSE